MQMKLQDKRDEVAYDRMKEKEHSKHFPYTHCKEYEDRGQAILEKLGIKE